MIQIINNIFKVHFYIILVQQFQPQMQGQSPHFFCFFQIFSSPPHNKSPPFTHAIFHLVFQNLPVSYLKFIFSDKCNQGRIQDSVQGGFSILLHFMGEPPFYFYRVKGLSPIAPPLNTPLTATLPPMQCLSHYYYQFSYHY